MRIESWRLAPADAGDAGRLALVGAASFLDGFAGLIGGDAMVAPCATKHNAEYYRDLPAPEGSQARLDGASPGGPAARLCLPSGAGRELTQRTCTGCHGVDAITAQGRTPDGWAQIINQMQNMGLSASEEDLVQIHAYLSRNLPPR